MAAHREFETAYAAHTPDYERIDLSLTTFHGTDAIRWEFMHDASPGGGGRLHVSSLYWRIGDHEYFVSGSAPTDEWPQMNEIISSMLEMTTP